MRRAVVRGSRLVAFILVFACAACSQEQAPAAQAPTATQPSATAQASPATEVATVSPPVNAPGTGWIEGTITDTNGTPVVVNGAFGSVLNMSVVLKTDGQDAYSQSDPAKAGFFSFRNVKPGLYEVFLDAARTPNNNDPLRPVRVHGVLVEAGKRTLLNVKMQPGKELEEIGKPVMTTQEFVVLSEDLKRLQAEIDELKKR